MKINEGLLKKHFVHDRYHIRGIWDEEANPTDSYDNPSALSMFFDGTDEEYMAIVEERSPTTAEAIRRNWQAAEHKAADLEAKAQAALGKVDRDEHLTNAERDVLVQAGYAYQVFDDPDSNRPTGIVIGTRGDGKPHADWEHEEGLASVGL